MAIATARDAADLLAPLFAAAAEERVAILYLDKDGRELALDAQPGAADFVGLPIRAIVARALALDARGLVIAHNHPSGDARPSAADRAATRRLAVLCEGLEIVLHDHLIFAGGECESLRRLGLL